jgi:transcriptional regulator with XRE-family HTH domain
LFGEVMRQIRRSKGFTLQQVAEATGLSVAFISQVENEQANPTLASLRKIAGILGTSTFALLAQGELEEEACTRLMIDRRVRVEMPGFNAPFEMLSPSLGGTRIQALAVTLDPGQETCTEPVAHGTWESEEWLLVMEGIVELIAGTEQLVVRTGESVHFHPAVPHKYRNGGNRVARIITVMNPPLF